MKEGDIVRHKKDNFIGKIKSIDNIFVHLEDNRNILKCYAEIIKEESNER